MMTDHLNEADEHERSERTGCRVTARKMPRSIERPSGQAEWSHKRDRVVRPSGHTIACGWVLVGRSSDQQCQARHPQELKREWAVFFVGTRYVASLGWLFGLGRVTSTWWCLRGGFSAEVSGAGYKRIGAWAADVVLRPWILLSFSWTRFGCVF